MKASTRIYIQKRAKNCCEYCKAQSVFSHDPFSADHIMPVSKGGLDALENLAWVCLGCNLYKSDFTEAVDLLTGTMVSIFHPRQNDWEVHFSWSPDATLILGETPMGRATISKLRLNRPGLVNLRRVLVETNNHPPL